MLSCEKDYGIRPGSVPYDLIARGTIVGYLCDAFGITDMDEADLSRCGESCAREGGLHLLS